MNKSTSQRDWRTVVREQGRTIGWLADQTGRPRRTVYGYSRNQLPPTAEWLASASSVLGVEVIHDSARDAA